jgi:tetratricopeptide (TPR) repeat protein
MFFANVRRSPLKSAALLAALALAAGPLGGCNHTSREARNAYMEYQVGNFAAAAAELKPDTKKKNENFVLNNCRYGSSALAAGQLPEAENAFMAAYEVMNGTKTNDGGRTLGAAVVFEGIKVWKGEPFERAMAHYYLGLIFLIKNDYENARAAFQNSLFKVREYASKDDLDHYKEVESNFALGYFGLGLCYLRTGKAELADASFKRAQAIDPRLGPVIAELQQPGVNTLLFVDAGKGPRKSPRGWYNEESAFGPTPGEVGPIPQIIATVDGQRATNPNDSYSTVDTLAMAQERRWQDIDTLRKAKAVIGTGMMAGGTGLAAYGAHRGDQGMMWAGIGTALAGAAVAASSQADTRNWEMLPRTVYIVPLALPPGPHTITVQVGGSQSAPLQATIQPPRPAAPSDNVFYFRLH